MKRLSTLLLIIFSTVSLFAQTKIIFDTDMDTDCDDAGALAILHALADNGEVEILATIVSTHYPYSAPCVEAINRYYGRPDILIGAPKSTWTDTGSRGSVYAHQISTEYETTLNTNDDAPDAVTVYRQILAAQESNSVVILSVGYLTNLRDLLESVPDSISPLSGVELVRQKVSFWVCTGGAYPSDYNPAIRGNYPPDPLSAVIAVRDWPGPIWFSGEGNDIGTGSLLNRTPSTNPVRRIYELYVGSGNTRPSWDPIATLFAARSNDVFWTFRTGGHYHIFNNGTYEWRNTPDKDHYVVEYDTGLSPQLRNTLDQLMIQPPKKLTFEKLQVSSNNRFLMTESGNSFFPIADTAWQIARRLNRQDVLSYLQIRKEQKFNTISLVAFPMDGTATNVYGKQPFEITGGKYDPLSPIVDTNSYDYWDHLDFIIDSAYKQNLYVIMLPAWGSRIAGDWGDGHPTDDIILDINNASNYACWISSRYKNYTNIIWMLGGDRSAVYGSYDYRPVFREMSAGILSGNTNDPFLMSYHPRKWKPNSSEWFHNDNWLSFNSIQDQPSDQINSIRHDYALSPAKPTWLFEGGYEERHGTDYGDWQVRFQAYQTVFAGGFGYTYGHMSIWDFASDWKTKINSSGANDMQHLDKLMTSITNEQFFNLIPDQSLLDGDTGSMTGSEGIISSCIVALRTVSNDLSMVYSANGRNIRLKMNQLSSSITRARWFNPRTGEFILESTNIVSGSGAPIIEFNPPGNVENGNDYILALDLGIVNQNPGPGHSLFVDNFNCIGSGGGINFEYTTRQSGTETPIAYTQSDGFTVTNIGPEAGKANVKTTGHNPKYLCPDHNFTESGNFSVECDITRYGSDDDGFVTMAIGTDGVNRDPAQSGVSGFKIKIWNNGGLQTYLNGVSISGSSSSFPELKVSSNPTLKVRLVVSQSDFTGSGYGYIAMFINNKAYILNGPRYIAFNEYDFLNNYISLSVDHYIEGTPINVDVDNLKVITETINPITTTAWTGDADSGIASSKVYTHAVNLADTANVVINGQTFIGTGKSAISGSNWEMYTGGSVSDFRLASESIGDVNVLPASGNLLVDFFWPYTDLGPAFTLTGLTPGQKYIFTIYSRGYSSGSGSRYNDVATSDGAVIAHVNATEFGVGNGQLLTYEYTANDDGVFTMSFTRDSGSWHCYAFSNEMAIPECSLFIGILTMGGLYIRRLS